jgi:hypothetical protein
VAIVLVVVGPVGKGLKIAIILPRGRQGFKQVQYESSSSNHLQCKS